jgi:hypothetical protein
MSGRTYQLKSPAWGIFTLGGQKSPVVIPTGGTVQVIAADTNGNRLVDVMWEGKTIMMFTTDLQDRGELVSSHTA